MSFATTTADGETPRVVKAMRKQDRNHLVSVAIMVAVMCGCAFYLAHEFGVAPF